MDCFYIALLESPDHWKCFTSHTHTFTGTFIHSWKQLPSKVQTCSSGAIWNLYMILYLCLPIHTHTIWGNLGLSILPHDTSTCRLEEPGIKPPTLADNLLYLLSNSCPQLYISAYPLHGCDWLELILADIGHTGQVAISLQSWHIAQTIIHVHFHTYRQFRVAN